MEKIIRVRFYADLMKAFILLYIDLPSPTAATIVLKLSSANTISEASLAT